MVIELLLMGQPIIHNFGSARLDQRKRRPLFTYVRCSVNMLNWMAKGLTKVHSLLYTLFVGPTNKLRSFGIV